MNTTTSKERLARKTKSNGRWMAHAIERGEHEALEKGHEFAELAQEKADEMVVKGRKMAKVAGAKAVAYGKAHPIKVAVGGVALGFFLAMKLLNGSKD
jgi:hypothetical protein